MTDEFLELIKIRTTLELNKEEIEQRKDFDQNQSQYSGFPDVDCYYEYKKLGGKENREQYFKNYDVFLKETMDIFVYGDPIRHKSRQKAWNTVIRISKISDAELDLLYHSVDNVMEYT